MKEEQRTEYCTGLPVPPHVQGTVIEMIVAFHPDYLTMQPFIIDGNLRPKIIDEMTDNQLHNIISFLNAVIRIGAPAEYDDTVPRASMTMPNTDDFPQEGVIFDARRDVVKNEEPKVETPQKDNVKMRNKSSGEPWSNQPSNVKVPRGKGRYAKKNRVSKERSFRN